MTDEKTLVKSTVSDPRLQPRTVINDPELTLETTEWLWVATGMRALDHAIETTYAKRHHPLSDALGAKACLRLDSDMSFSQGVSKCGIACDLGCPAAIGLLGTW